MDAEGIRVGGYQLLTLALLSVNFVVVAMSHALTIFYKYTPRFYCEEERLPGSEEPRNRSYGCGCAGRYVFEANNAYESPAMEWRLVCERESLLRAAGDAYFGALLLGGLLAGPLADRIGRLPVLAICLYAQGTMAVALNVVQDYNLFLVFRTLQGFFIQGLESCTYILCMELFPAKFRTLVALVILSVRSFGLALLSGLSYGVPDWRILQLVISVPTAATVLYIWIIPESPRWLIAKGKMTEAEMLLEKIDNYNRLCGSSKRGEDSEKRRESQVDKRPQKPKRKRRTSSDNGNSSTDVEKSLEESKNLLSSSELESPRAHTSSEGKNEDGMIDLDPINESDLPVELDIEEISKASLLVLPDESSTSDIKEEGVSGPSFILVSKEALSTNATNKGANDNKYRERRFSRFLDSRFIGRTCVIMMCLWLTSSMTFHGLVSLPQRLSRDRHVSLVLAAAVEVVSFLLTYLVVSSRCGRRRPLCAAQLLVGGACLTIGVIALLRAQVAAIEWLAYARMTIIVFGRIANISSFFILRLLVIELFPTVSRGTGVGLCIGAEMIGGLLTPYILMLNNYVPELARFLIGLLSILASFLCLKVPETLYEILPDSVEAAKNLGQKMKDIKCNTLSESIDRTKNSEALREKLFSEDWVDAGNGIIVNFTDKKNFQ